MKVTLESTTKVVQLVIDGHSIPARIWEGTTSKGIRCHTYITRIAVHKDDNAGEFEADLKEQAVPSADIANIPLRLII